MKIINSDNNNYHNILLLNQQIEKLKELQSDAKPHHVLLLEQLLQCITSKDYQF